MIIGRKIRLKPTKEQEILFWKSAGVARWAYNFLLAENERVYKEYLDNNKIGPKSISENVVRKYINNVLKPTTHSWLKEVGSNVMKQAVKDADNARKRWFSRVSGKPKFKSKKHDKPSFYVNYESLKRKNHGFQGEKLGFVLTSEQLPRLEDGQKYMNPRISFDGKYWYLSISYEIHTKKQSLTNISLGIDLGIKDFAIVSNGTVYKNINKVKTVKRLKKKLLREQRKLSRKLESNIRGYTNNRKPLFNKKIDECRNYQKQKQKIKLLHRRLHNIRYNNLHQVTTEIVKTKPFRIVIEDLNVSGMMKNRHLARAVQEQCFYIFRELLTYKCEKYGIQLVIANRFYPSSKICSCCGHKKSVLKLSDRTYHCDSCGYVIDRDLNAAINLSKYAI